MSARDPRAYEDWLVSYLPRLVRWGGLAESERRFCVSVLGRVRRSPGARLSVRQVAWLRDLVERFRTAEFTEATGQVR